MNVENIGPSWGLRACLWGMQKTPLTRFPRFLGVFILFSWMREKLKWLGHLWGLFVCACER